MTSRSSRDGIESAIVAPRVLGIDVDANTRCAHYHSDLDIIAIKLHCCGEYYACRDCHDTLADHPLTPWPGSAHDTRAILCGKCGEEQTIREYLHCENRCPACGAAFNPRCRDHHHFYFLDP